MSDPQAVSVVLSGDTDRPVYVLGQPMTYWQALELWRAFSWALHHARAEDIRRHATGRPEKS